MLLGRLLAPYQSGVMNHCIILSNSPLLHKQILAGLGCSLVQNVHVHGNTCEESLLVQLQTAVLAYLGLIGAVKHLESTNNYYLTSGSSFFT